MRCIAHKESTPERKRTRRSGWIRQKSPRQREPPRRKRGGDSIGKVVGISALTFVVIVTPNAVTIGSIAGCLIERPTIVKRGGSSGGCSSGHSSGCSSGHGSGCSSGHGGGYNNGHGGGHGGGCSSGHCRGCSSGGLGRQQSQFGGAGVGTEGRLGVRTHDGIAGGFGPEHDVFMLAVLTGYPAAVAVNVAPMFIAQLIIIAIVGRSGDTQHGQCRDD